MIRKSVYKLSSLLALLIMLVSTSVFGQYNSEEELKEAANKMFEEEKYHEAMPLFGQLLSLYPKDLDYNFKYGTCVLVGSKEKEDALKYLKFATSKSTVNPLAYYFLAKAYHHNYQFSQAKVYYNKFKTKAPPKDIQRFDVDREIVMCENGENLVKSMTDIGVLSRKDIRRTDFFRSYDLAGIGGKIVVKPDEFKTKLDKKRNESSIIYLGEKRDMVVFSSYGKTGVNGKDLYKVVKLPNGEWSDPSPLAEELNSKFDEDYPFLHPDGSTLYFCSKGYNSMGGYDVFKSTLDLRTGKWSYPENLDFPINTPDDDILYISDIDNQLAYFASSRASKQGELTVYRVTVDPAPVENSVVKGFFLAEANPEMKDATITVKDAEKDRRYGVYKTHSVSGEYLLVFPSNGGKFKILVETTSDAPIHSAVIELPELESFRALKQELRLVGEGSDEKLVVKNLFDETDEFDINDPLVVEHILKKKAQLEVNTTEEEVLSQASKTEIVAETESTESEYSELSNEELVNKTDNLASKLIEQTEESKQQTNTAFKKAEDNSLKAKQLFTESEQLFAEANEATDEEEKKQKQALAEQKKLEAASYVNQTIAALSVAKTLENEVVERTSDASKINNLQEKINSNIDNGNRVEAEKNLSQLDEIASATYHTTSAIETEKELSDKKLSEAKEIYSKARNKATELRNRENEIEKEVEQLKNQLTTTKKKSEKEDLQARIDVLTIDLEDNEFELDKSIVAEDKAKKAYEIEKSKAQTSQQIITEIANSDNTVANIDESKKLQIENDIVYFEKEGLVGLYAEADNETTELEIYSLADHKEEYDIVDEQGNLIDYNTKRSVELAEVDGIEDENKRTKRVIKINESWIKDIDEEIALRNEQLAVELNANKKAELENKIAALETLKEQKQKELNENKTLLAANSSNTETTEIAENTSNENNTTFTNEVSTNNTVTTEKVNIINEDGSIKDYETIYTEQLNSSPDEDTYEAYIEKAKIHQNWVEATKEELLIRKMELQEADESEKAAIENKIAILENDLTEQEEYVAIYEMQAEAMQPESTDLATNEQPENNSLEVNTNNNTTNQTEVTESSTTINEAETTTTENELAENTTNEFSTTETSENIESTNEVENNSSETELAENTTETSANNESTNESSTSAATKVPVYELTSDKLNGEEDEFSNLKYYEGFEYQSDLSKESVANVSVMKSEAKQLKDEADVKLNEAASTNNATKKAELISESDALIKQSEEKQEQIARAYETANRKEYQNNQTVIEELKKANTDEYSNQALMIEMYEEEANSYYAEAQIERERAINATNFTVKESALQKAYELEMKAINKQNMAINQISSDNLNEAIATAENNNTNETETTASNRIANETETSESETNSTEINEIESAINENEVAENTTVNETSTNETNTSTENESTTTSSVPLSSSSPEISDEDIAVIQQLKSAEVIEIKNSENYQNYAELKKENRRLVKEAEVEYAEAEIYEQDAADQKQLGVTLKAMAEGSSNEADKAKKLEQIEKLNAMIAENESKSAELKQSAATKEGQAESAKQQSDAILINAEESEAAIITALEKIETYDADLMAEIEKNAANETETANELATNEQPENNSSEANESNRIANETETEISENSNVTNESEINTTETELAENTTNESSENNTAEAETVNEVETNTNSNETELVENTSLATNETENSENEFSNNENETTENTTTEIVETSTESTTVQPSLSNIDEVPEKLNQSIFVMSNNQPVYNESNPIPSAEKMPEGLVFKVQIGAFRNPIPQNHFKGFAPIMAEDAGNGITRYTAGLFNSFNMANEAKNSIRSIGYSDAFVVAFYNGKRIGVSEARAMIDDNVVAENNFSIEENTTPTNTNTETPSNTSTNELEKITTEEVKDGVSTDVRNIDGVFYAVQVGVYSKPVTAGQLSNVSPLNSERLESGLIRYTSGNFKNLNDANAAKDRIRAQGIADAFVVAYNGGRRVPVAEATQLLKSSGTESETTTINQVDEEENSLDGIAETVENENVEMETPIEEESTITETETETETETSEKSYSGEDLNIEFKVKLGEYEEDVPVEDAARFLQLTGRGVKNYEEGNKTIYVIGSFPDYQSALDLQIEMKEMGVENPETIAFKDGNPIGVEEALDLIKNQ